VTLLALLLSVSLSELWQRATRETSSHAAAARGVTDFARKKYDEAMASFARANALRPTPQSAFNLGTSQIAGGKQEEGSTTLQKALADRRLRADALYNRGNSALAAKAFDYAIRDYVETLKLRPSDASAKRNLEIALQRKQQQEQQQKQQQQQQQGGGKQQQPQPKPGEGNKDEQKPKSDPNVEALLRSVQQQEREELARMNRPRPERLRVGW
jgi:Ca-activated chloride channel family protein